jgi:hypothetical protein
MAIRPRRADCIEGFVFLARSGLTFPRELSSGFPFRKMLASGRQCHRTSAVGDFAVWLQLADSSRWCSPIANILALHLLSGSVTG